MKSLKRRLADTSGDVLDSCILPKRNGAYWPERFFVERMFARLADALPRLMAQHGFSNPFLKMDTQGFDLEVLAGAGELAKCFCGLLSGVAVRKIYANSPDMVESLHAFDAAGFNFAALHLAEGDQPD